MLTTPLKDRTKKEETTKMKRLIIATIPLLLLALLLIPLTASAASGVYVKDKTGDDWVGDTWQVDVYPGESKSTILTLHNPSGSSLATTVSITPASLDNGNLVFELNKHYFTISGGKYAEVILSVTASNSATPGNYTTALKIKSEVPPSGPGGGGGGGGGSCSLKIDMLGDITNVRMSCSTDKTLEAATASSTDNICLLEIDSFTVVICDDTGEAPAGLIIKLAEELPPVMSGVVIIGPVYNFTSNYRTSACGQPKHQCSGVAFSKDAILTLGYDSLPEGVTDLMIARYSGNGWIGPSCPVDYESNTITTSISHITPGMFAIIGAIAPPVPVFSVSTLAIAPDQPMPNESVTICVFASNTGEAVGDYPVMLEINGIKETEKIVSIAPGGRQLVCFNVTREDAREYVVCVNGLCDVFFVETPQVARFNTWLVIGLVMAAIAIIIAIVLVIRRERARR